MLNSKTCSNLKYTLIFLPFMKCLWNYCIFYHVLRKKFKFSVILWKPKFDNWSQSEWLILSGLSQENLKHLSILNKNFRFKTPLNNFKIFKKKIKFFLLHFMAELKFYMSKLKICSNFYLLFFNSEKIEQWDPKLFFIFSEVKWLDTHTGEYPK